jgi:putative membrane protein
VRWLPVAGIVTLQIAYPLTPEQSRSGLVVVTVLLGCAYSVGHAWLTHGARAGLALVGVAATGLVAEILGVATGLPFGHYTYTGTLGPRLFNVPVVVGAAWAWMAWPAWLVALRLGRRRSVRIAVAMLALATWDLFLDPRMVAEGFWRWSPQVQGLPGVPGVPWSDYAGWLLVAVAVAAGLSIVDHESRVMDTPMLAFYLWTYSSSVLANAAFFDLPGSAAWGAAGMGLIAVPLAARLTRRRRQPDPVPAS